MMERDDMTLLREYAEAGSEPAFAGLVEKYVNLVYSTALRGAGSAPAAEEITQAVFIILARKAKILGAKTVLSGWLYQTTRLTAANFLRAEIRRQNREQEAYMQALLNEPEPEIWPQIAPLLDAAMDRLGEKDRNAIVLRFFQNKSLLEVGAALGASEDAAKMRVNRALGRLRKMFTRRGVTLPAALIAGAVSANSVQAAPAALAKAVTVIAATKGAAASGSTLTLIKGALKLMAWTKAKTAVVVGAGVLLAAGTTTVAVKQIRSHQAYPWQLRNFDSRILDRVPPQVRILPAKFSDFGGSGEAGDKMMALGVPVKEILQYAYGQSSARTVLPRQLPGKKYDFIANLRAGNKPALQEELNNRFGLVGRRETRETNVLRLEIQNSAAPGLKTANPRQRKPEDGVSSMNWGPGRYSCRNTSLASLASFLEGYFGIPVIDRTGLTDPFDIDLQWDEKDMRHHNPDALKRALLDELGLELTPAREAVEMLVVEKEN